MPVAAPVTNKTTQVIARGRDRARAQSQAAPAATGLPGIVKADMPPGPAVARQSDDPHIRSEINQSTAHALSGEELSDVIDGIFLAHPSQIDAHTHLRQEDLAWRALKASPSDQPFGLGN